MKPASSTACGRSTIRVGSAGRRGGPRRQTDLGHGEGQLAQPFVGGRGDRRRPASRAPRGRPRPSSASSLRVGHVDLVERDHPRPVVQAAVGLELGLDHVEVGDRVAAGLHGGAVDDVHQHAAALDVAQELLPEPLALARASDQAGHVGHGEAHLAGLDHARGSGTSVVNG